MTLAKTFEEGKRLFKLRIKNQEKAIAKFYENKRYNEIQKRINT